MNIKVNNLSKLNRDFPKLMVGIKNPNCIVFFKEKEIGVIISSDSHSILQGLNDNTFWDMSDFTDFEGSITLSND